ncbi:MAG: hypothetical protein K940chlam6_01308 [Chlamydiae bacterium]|nr:hypothetical protein [Chlamydiota bacterium]
MVGVEHFYLFNNLSDDQYLEVLEPYVQQGIVELFEWNFVPKEHKNWTKVQCGAYNTLIKSQGSETFWLAIIDIDEFIVPIKKQDLKDFLKGYERYAGLGINWQNYGTSGVYRIPENQTQIGTLTKRAPEKLDRNRFVKSIFQPKKIKNVKKPHHCIYKKGWFHVTENKKPFAENKSLTDSVSVNKIRINHYTYHDEEFFYTEKRRRVQEWFPESLPLEMDPNYNEVEDSIMLRYVPELEQRLFGSD